VTWGKSRWPQPAECSRRCSWSAETMAGQERSMRCWLSHKCYLICVCVCGKGFPK